MPLNEPLLSPDGSLSACRCGQAMGIARTRALPGGRQGHVQVYECAACHHEMHLTVWSADVQLMARDRAAATALVAL
jgi:hypothetical protein